MQEIIPFDYQGTSIRTVTKDGVTLWCGKDIATTLGYQNTKDALARHCHGVVKRYPIVDRLGRTQQARFISEPDLYRLIINSKLPDAQNFEKWVFEEVLPTIRNHGAYLTPQKIEEVLTDPDTIIQLATNLKREQERRRALENKVKDDAPKVLFADSVTTAKTSILVGQLAKLITQNGHQIGQNRLFAWLRDNGYLSRRKGADWNMPCQQYVEAGLFEIKESTHTQPDGVVRITRTPKVTGKGQVFFLNKFLEAA